MSYVNVTRKINVDGICKYAMHSNGNDINILIGNLFKLNYVLKYLADAPRRSCILIVSLDCAQRCA